MTSRQIVGELDEIVRLMTSEEQELVFNLRDAYFALDSLRNKLIDKDMQATPAGDDPGFEMVQYVPAQKHE